jgi:hypothetical protein
MAARTPVSRRRKRRRRGDGLVWKLVVPITLLVIVAVVAIVLLRPSAPPVALPTKPACPQVPTVTVGTINVPAGPIEGYCQAALVNAAQIITAERGFSGLQRAMDIGVMVGIGESNLQNLGYGDVAGPDSRGVFQQRSNWGTLAQRMDPYTAAHNFYIRMFHIVGWQSLAPTVVAHTVQGNANPNYYAPYFSRADRIVTALLADQTPPSLAVIPTPIPTPPGKP